MGSPGVDLMLRAQRDALQRLLGKAEPRAEGEAPSVVPVAVIEGEIARIETVLKGGHGAPSLAARGG